MITRIETRHFFSTFEFRLFLRPFATRLRRTSQRYMYLDEDSTTHMDGTQKPCNTIQAKNRRMAPSLGIYLSLLLNLFLLATYLEVTFEESRSGHSKYGMTNLLLP